MVWPLNNEEGRPSMEDLFRAAIENRSNLIPYEAFRRQRADPPVLKRDLELMEFKSEMFFFSAVCNVEHNDDEYIDAKSELLTDKYNLDKKIRRNRKLFLEKRRPALERDIYKEFPKELPTIKIYDKRGLDFAMLKLKREMEMIKRKNNDAK